MNHYTVEFLARDHLAELRREAGRPRSEPPVHVANHPDRAASRAIHRLLSRLRVGMQLSPRHG
jgi:hypothetical protein